MREVLFKAKRIDNGEWVEGYYLCDNLKNNDMQNDYERHLIASIEKETQTNTIKTMFYEIDPNTLSQYTGLKDKNGNMIFENDILKFDDESFVGLCVYKEEIAQFMFGDYSKDRDWFDFQPQMTELSIIIIGNKFDNKEGLIK